jgi:hypothetical protein
VQRTLRHSPHPQLQPTRLAHGVSRIPEVRV